MKFEDYCYEIAAITFRRFQLGQAEWHKYATVNILYHKIIVESMHGMVFKQTWTGNMA